MIMELLRDNRKIVDQISKQHIRKFCKFIRRNKNYRYLDLLNVLCICDGIALPENQNYITKKYLVQSAEKNLDNLFYTEVGQKISEKENIVYLSIDSRKTWQPLHDFAAKAFTTLGTLLLPSATEDYVLVQTESNKTAATEMYFFLEFQLKLFCSLCHVSYNYIFCIPNGYNANNVYVTKIVLIFWGRNIQSIEVITEKLKYLTWEEAFAAMTDYRIPNQLRAVYCKLISDLFINIEGNYSVLDRLNLVFVYPDVPMPGAAPIERNDSILSACVALPFVKNLKNWIWIFLDHNRSMVSSLTGTNKFIEAVLTMVGNLVEFGYYGDTEDIKKLLEPMLSLLDGRNDLPFPISKQDYTPDITSMIASYRDHERFLPNIQTAGVVAAKYQALRIVDLFFNFRFNTRLEKFVSTFKFISASGNRKSMSNDVAVLLKPGYSLKENLQLNKEVMEELKGVFSESSYISSDFVEILMDLCNYQHNNLIRKAMGLLNRYYSAHEDLFQKAVQAQVLLTEQSCMALKKIQSHMPVLKLVAYSLKLNEENVANIIDILDDFTELCKLPEDPEESHYVNQQILYNHGVLSDVFDILAIKANPLVENYYTQICKVFQGCFKLLRAMAASNPTVQERLFNRLSILLTIKEAVDELALLFIEIFHGNKSVCLRILPAHISEIVDLLSRTGNSTVIRLLTSLVMVDQIPIKRNQTLVLKALLQHPKSVQCLVESTTESRMQLMTSEKQQSDLINSNTENSVSQRKVYFCNIVQLLGYCAWGDNRTVESVCQCMFKVDELLSIIIIPNLCGGLRKAFIQFLTSVFLNSASDEAALQLKNINEDRNLWQYFSLLADELEVAAIFASDSQSLCRSLLKVQPHVIHKHTSDKVHEMKELLHYLFDSAMRLVTIFFRQHFAKSMDYSTQAHGQLCSATAPNINTDGILMHLINRLHEFGRVIYPGITSVQHLNTLSLAYKQLLVAAKLNEKVPGFLLAGLADSGVDTKKLYFAYYAAENDLNQQLNAFAENARKVYGGGNTVFDQIGFFSAKTYSDTDSDDSLPLGKEFQDFVNCFSSLGNLVVASSSSESGYQKAGKLINQLKHSLCCFGLSESEKVDQESLDVKCLQLLRALLYNEIVKLPEYSRDNKQWYNEQLQKIRTIQNTLVDLAVIQTVVPHLSYFGDTIPKEVLALLKNLLFDGNPVVQNDFMRYCLSTQEENFFFCIQSRIQRSASTMKERRALLVQHRNLVQQQQRYVMSLFQKKGVSSAQSHRSFIDKSSNIAGINKLKSAMGTHINKPQTQESSLEPEKKKVDNDFEMLEVAIDGNELKTSVKPTSGVKQNSRLLQNCTASSNFWVTDSDDAIEDLLEYKDTGYIEMILEMLGLLCDGQNKSAQDYIREQRDNIKSVNLVAEVGSFLQLMYSNVCRQTIRLVTKLFETMTELCQGNIANQIVIFDQKVLDHVNFILRKNEFPECTLSEVIYLKFSIGMLVKTMIEGNSSYKHTEEVVDSINKDEVWKTMVEMHEITTDSNYSSEISKDIVFKVGHIYCCILCRVFDVDHSLEITRFTNNCIAWTYFMQNTESVEILKEGQINKVYFIVKDKKVLRNWVKEKLSWEVDRSSPTNKLQDFLNWSRSIRHDITNQRRINSNVLTRILVRGWKPLNFLVLLLSFLLNIGILVSWRLEKQSNDFFPVTDILQRDNGLSYFRYIMFFLSLMHNLMSVLLLTSYMLSQKPIFPNLQQLLKRTKKSRDDSKMSHLQVNFFSFQTFYYLIFFCLSVLGTTITEALFAFHLLHIVANNQLLLRVIKAITLNGRSLLWVAFLGLIIIYIYGLLGFLFLQDIFDENHLFCKSMWECFLTIMREGLLYGLTERFDIADDSPNLTFHYYGLKILFDISFFVIITIIGLNMIFGIIVDTFSELRDSKWKIENDMNTTCFICSKTTSEFEHHGKGFKKHVSEEHNMWSYIYFFIYLDDMPYNDMSSLELHVYNMVQEDQCDFFPLGRALTLSQWEENHSDTRLELLLEHVDILVKRMHRDDLNKLKEAEKRRQEEWWEDIQSSSDARKRSLSQHRPSFSTMRSIMKRQNSIASVTPHRRKSISYAKVPGEKSSPVSLVHSPNFRTETESQKINQPKAHPKVATLSSAKNRTEEDPV